MHFFIAVDQNNKPLVEPIPDQMKHESEQWKTIDTPGPQLHTETLDRYADFFVANATISGFCIVLFNLKRMGLKLNQKLGCHRQ